MADSGAEKRQKVKKINRLTLVEIEAQLEEIRRTQGGWYSRYARHLLERKKVLSDKD